MVVVPCIQIFILYHDTPHKVLMSLVVMHSVLNWDLMFLDDAYLWVFVEINAGSRLNQCRKILSFR